MSGGVGTEVRGVQGGPLTAGAQHVEDGVGTLPIGGARLTPAKPMGVPVLREQALQPYPQGIRHTKVGCHLIHGCSLASLSRLYHALTLSNPGYPDRL